MDNSEYSSRFLPVPAESAARDMEYRDFPKVLIHPNHQPARLITPGIPGTFNSNPIEPVWEAEKFPSVTAQTAEQEKRYRTMGYGPAGQSDPVAFATAHVAPRPSDYEFQPYPQWLTPESGGDPVLVKNLQEEAAVRARWKKDDTKKRTEAERRGAPA